MRRLCKGLLLPLLLSLSACNSANISDIADIARAKNPVKQAGKILEQKGKAVVANPQALPEELRELKAKITIFKRLIDSIWGDADLPQAGPKDYVKYTDKYYNRAHIDFEAGVVRVDTLAPDDQAGYLKKAIITTLLTPDDPREVDLYSDVSPEHDGAGNVLKTFSSDRSKVIANINQLSPGKVYDRLTSNHPSQETRRYLRKVTDAHREFWE
jgi:hypothetical protein